MMLADARDHLRFAIQELKHQRQPDPVMLALLHGLLAMVDGLEERQKGQEVALPSPTEEPLDVVIDPQLISDQRDVA